MKNEYFGDINDYRKYGLLRCLPICSDLRLLVAWMLTPTDPKRPGDGKYTGYLNNGCKYRCCDPELFEWLGNKRHGCTSPNVALIEGSGLLRDTAFYSEEVPEDRASRTEWAERLHQRAESADIVFLDPDNGIEVPSVPLGRKGCSRYVYWNELRRLHAAGKSLLIYQHFARAKRESFIKLKLEGIKKHLNVLDPRNLAVYRTPNVVFFLVSQRKLEVTVPQHWVQQGQLWQWAHEI